MLYPNSDESYPDWSWIPDFSFKNYILKVASFGHTYSNLHLLVVCVVFSGFSVYSTQSDSHYFEFFRIMVLITFDECGMLLRASLARALHASSWTHGISGEPGFSCSSVIIRPSGVLCYGTVRLSVQRPFPRDNLKSFTAIDLKPGI